MQIIRSPKVYDVVVVGSGAAGGMTAMVLCKGGAKVLMLEAGGWFDWQKDPKMLMWPYEAPLRGVDPKLRNFGYFDAATGGWEVDGEPYTNAPGTDFQWFRGRMLGGRTNHWGRISLRMGPYDFKPYTRDGLGFDWPITYDDVAPYYDKTEAFIGVFGSKENIENAPDGVFLPPPKPRCKELWIQQYMKKLGLPVISSRLSILTKSINGRPACHYCDQCGRGCATGSNFSSPAVLIPPAQKTGNLEIRTDAMVREVLSDDEGKATGVSYIDRKTRQEVQVRAKVVVLAASGCESARIMLNSKSARFPNGIGNSSGEIGKSLMDTVGVHLNGYFPQLESIPPHNDDGVGGGHLYVPWWNYQKKMDFPRGYHIEFGGGRSMPGPGIFGGAEKFTGGGYGKELKASYRRIYGASMGMSGRGEMIPNKDCWCEIDPDVVDQWGIPVLKFHWKWNQHEILQAKHMLDTFKEIIETAGGEPQFNESHKNNYGIEPGGRIIHEVGCARMGDDPRTSVLNGYCAAHDVPNLYVTDGACFASNADKNPTLTIMALAWRSSDNILEKYGRKA